MPLSQSHATARVPTLGGPRIVITIHGQARSRLLIVAIAFSSRAKGNKRRGLVKSPARCPWMATPFKPGANTAANGFAEQADDQPRANISRLQLAARPDLISPRSDSEAPKVPPIIIPPYWAHKRHISNASSLLSVGPRGIRLEDNTTIPEEDSPGSPLWARSAEITDHVRIEGDIRGAGGYVVWIIRVETLDVCRSNGDYTGIRQITIMIGC